VVVQPTWEDRIESNATAGGTSALGFAISRPGQTYASRDDVELFAFLV
jgi:hypothetical protein